MVRCGCRGNDDVVLGLTSCRTIPWYGRGVGMFRLGRIFRARSGGSVEAWFGLFGCKGSGERDLA